MKKTNTKPNKKLLAKVIITIAFITIFVLHTIIKNIQIDSIGLILITLAFIPWLQSILESIEIPGFKAKFKSEDMDEATREIKFEKDLKEAESSEIAWNASISYPVNASEFEKHLISFKARINYDHEAGSNYLMRIKVNEIYLNENYIVNKESIQIKGDGRQFYWYSKEYNSWSLCFSPDFITNYMNSKYRIKNSDPYLFVFDISAIKPIDNKFTVIIEHNGREENIAFRNPIIILDFKSN